MPAMMNRKPEFAMTVGAWDALLNALTELLAVA